MSLQIIANDVAKNPNNKWLVLCPLILIENAWLDDANKFFPGLSVVSLHAKTKKARLARFESKANIYLMNIESFINYKEHIEKLGIHGCIVDESSTMKSHSAKFAKAAVDFAYKVKRWYLLSGTPAPNGEYEYYMQLRSIDYFAVHSSWTQFTDYFFNNISRNPQYKKLVMKPEKKEEMNALLKQYSVYVDKEDVLETPGREFIEYKFDIPADLRKQYDKLRQDLYYELLDEEGNTEEYITAASAAAARNKLNQVTSGFIIDTDAKHRNKQARHHGLEQVVDTHDLSHYRYIELDRLLKQIGNEQVLIWCNYRNEFKILKELYKSQCVCVYGGMTIAEKNQALSDFKLGKAQYLFANPASADKGLTLTNARYAIYFSLTDSYELFKQSMERIYGGVHSQKNKCYYYIMLANKSIDEIIYAGVMRKKDLSMEVLNHLKGGE